MPMSVMNFFERIPQVREGESADGGVISRMEEVTPTARDTGKSTATQTQSLKPIPSGSPVWRVEPGAKDRPPSIRRSVVTGFHSVSFEFDPSYAGGTVLVGLLTAFRNVLLLRLEPSSHLMPAEGLLWVTSYPVPSRPSGLTPSLPAVRVSSCPVTGRFSAF
jgi:hypothetical protein